MFAEFETFIRANTTIGDDDIKLMSSLAVQKTLRKKEFLFHQGEICRYKIFVSKGMLRMFSTKEDGSEYILHFSSEDSWCTDPESFDHQIPSHYNVDALENSEVILWTKNDFNFLFANIPALNVYIQKMIYKNMGLVRERIRCSISLTPEEKYEDFVKNHPDIMARVPLHMVASYLGVSLKTISRVRQAQLLR
jgi:CRP-like cAMP-binding protein